MKYFIIYLFLFIRCSELLVTHASTQLHCIDVPQSLDEGTPIAVLPNNGFIEYTAASKDIQVTPQGIVYAKKSLKSYIEENKPIKVNSKDYVTGVHTKHELQFHEPGSHVNSYASTNQRWKRAATQLSVTKQVQETANEISIDYANAGVQMSSNNRFYMQSKEESVPLDVVIYDGRLTLSDESHRMDYETAPNKRYEFTVYINNTQNSAEYLVSVTIKLIDVNDEIPSFTMQPQPYLATVDPNLPIGSLVDYPITVQDADNNKKLQLSLLSGDSDFRIDQNGQIYTKRQLIRGQEYTVRIQVEDQNAVEHAPQAVVAEVKILAGQRSPQFYQSNYEVYLPENTPASDLSVVIKAKSFQGDAIAFSMQESNIFEIRPMTNRPNEAKVRSTTSLDYETDRQSYVVVITATERGTGLSSTVQLTVRLTDVNDNSPRFDISDYVDSKSWPENLQSGTEITTVRAVDKDPAGSPNGKITYSLQADNNKLLPFTVETRAVANGYEGVIKTSGKLDYESIDKTGYRFKVIASDQGVPSRSGSAYVRVRVLNTNDEAPVFQSSRIERIEPTKSVGSTVTTVLASDPDGDRVTYRIEPGPTVPFSINQETGAVTLTDDLTANNYKDISSFTFNVSATDDGSCCSSDSQAVRNTGYTRVIIEIVGRNHPPEFPDCNLYSSTAKAPEETNDALVIKVKAVDSDVGPNGELRYSLLNDRDGEFKIDSVTGEIRTAKGNLDREESSRRTLTVKAEDSALSKLSAYCTFTMVLEDLNDNAPKLAVTDSQGVQINSPPRTSIYTLYATDPDQGANGTQGITWSVTGNDNFYVEGNVLYNSVTLSSTLPTTQTMTITAKDGQGRSTSTTFKVIIEQSASPPLFTDIPPSDFSIFENTKDDTIIYKIKATAADGGPVNYYVVPTTTRDAFYARTDDADCNTNNKLCLAIYKSDRLDVDSDNPKTYFIRVRVTPQDKGSYVVAEKTIQIQLKDVNDNIPVFENQDDNGYIIGSFPESEQSSRGRVAVVLKANDSDVTESFKTKSYYLESGQDSQYFTVEESTGRVLVATDRAFDRESETPSYFIKVSAIDGAPSSRPGSSGSLPNKQVADVQINLADVNDNPPYFEKNQYNGTVEETAPKGTTVMTVKAMDKDIDNNFQYSIISGDPFQAFEITNTGDILVLNSGKLDYETQVVYNLVVEVSDGLFTSRTNVHIKLLDMNDNVPEFSQNIYSVNNVVEEDSSISTTNRKFLVRVKATDADTQRRNNITYDLSGSYSDYFYINPLTGDVYLVKKLDRDDQPRWDVNVLANDEPGYPTNRIGYAIVSVFPKDINDNNPVFDLNSLVGYVDENQPPGRPVMTVVASDKDEGNNGTVKFRFEDASTKPTDFPDSQYYPYFEISPTGSISTKAIFDREKVDKYTVKVIAYDEGTPTSKSTIQTATIRIRDQNDNPPKFVTKFYERKVSELSGPSTYILQLEATDPDINDTLAYTLDSQGVKNFTIDNEGRMYLRDQPLDYEYFYYNGLKPQMNMTVTVSDGGLPINQHTDTATIMITVVNENDETPIFKPNALTVNLMEDVAIGTIVADMNATDRDSKDVPRNSEIEYLISRALGSDVDRYFEISNDTGIIRTRKNLDRETVPSHTIVVLAVDNGYPYRRTGTATVTVDLKDINDNGPKLVTPIVYIAENMPVGSATSPQEIRAMDEDDNDVGHGPPFTMSATNGSQNSRDFNFIFHSDWDTPAGLTVPNGAGELKAKRVLDREGDQGAEIEFYLKLLDNKGVSADRTLTVVIADEDDNKPSPGHKDVLIYNYKGEYDLVEIGDCYAEDKDDWDKPYKSYDKYGTWPDGFDIDKADGMMTANLSVVPSGVYEFKCKVIDNYIPDTTCAFNCNNQGGTAAQIESCKSRSCRVKAEVISTVKATIKTIDEAPVWSGASIRLKGTAFEFVQPGSDGKSPYDKFISRLASSLDTDVSAVDVFSVLDSTTPGYVDVRYTAHGSPFYNSSKLLHAVLADDGLQNDLGMVLAQVPVNECLKEICEGGCTNTLSITDQPTLVNANGSALVGVTSRVEAKCACETAVGSGNEVCSPDSCLNGGTCVYHKTSKKTSCECPSGFDGPRCQQLRHSFNGRGWAQYKTLPQCGNGSTSIEILTKQSDGLILYNGPNINPGSGPDAVTDYIAITVANGKPVIYINYGTGHMKLSVNKNVNDGFWHKLDISKVDRTVSLVVDDCIGAKYPDTDTSVISTERENCKAEQTTPGENRFLNVGTLLVLGGRVGSNNWWPSEVVTRSSYDGCVRNLKHNGELYDLHIGSVGSHSNTEDGCPREDSICIKNGSPVCGRNGICSARLDGGYSCKCRPGWRGDKCDKETTYMDYSQNSFVEWELLSSCSGSSQCAAESYTTDIQLSFRSRDSDGSGLLFSVKGNSGTEYINLQLVEGKIQLRYNIGSDSWVQSQQEQVVGLPILVTDGALHTVKVTRVGKRFTLQLDGGEGDYIAHHEGIYSHQLFTPDKRIFSGADGTFAVSTDSNITSNTDLENSCVTDVRYNGNWFPATSQENSDNSDVRLVRRQNVADGCKSDACANVACPRPALQQCIDLWRDHECSCVTGYVTLSAAPYCKDINECFPDNPCVNGRCVNVIGSYQCDCFVDDGSGKQWQGETCAVLPGRSTLLVGQSGILAIVLAIVLAMLLALAIFILAFRKKRQQQKDDYLYDPYDDIRETIYNYDEEGMPEEDQDGYDIRRLSKPVDPVAPVVTEKPLMAAPPLDQPDVGNFIYGRLNDADDDPDHLPGDELLDFAYEGEGSDAGTLSSLNTSSSGGDQDFDFLNNYGPKFSRLADMYNGDDDML